jgi:hypothetical protein
MQALSFQSETCPDGVELVDYGPEKPPKKGATLLDYEKFGRWFRYRTNRRAAVRVEMPGLENPAVVAYINARDDTQRASFFSRYGLWAPEIDASDVRESQQRFRALLRLAGGKDQTAAVESVNAAIASHRSFNLQPEFDLASGSPRMLLKAQSLLGFMLMESAMVAAHGARFATCEHCAAAFLTGPLTWRRAHARYCSDKCRVAAMRARNADRK